MVNVREKKTDRKKYRYIQAVIRSTMQVEKRIISLDYNIRDGENRYCLSGKKSLRKIPKLHLISWCGNFVERHSQLGEISVFYAVSRIEIGALRSGYSCKDLLCKTTQNHLLLRNKLIRSKAD